MNLPRLLKCFFLTGSLFMLLLVPFGCIKIIDEPDAAATANPASGPSVVIADVGTTDGLPLVDPESAYEFDTANTSVICMYLTVRQGNSTDNTNHTWAEVNAHSVLYYLENNLERNRCEAILQVGDENGPVSGELGYDETAANAIVQLRGNTSSTGAQKSYKIEVMKGKGTWRDQRTIALNKHAFDPSKFRNKLMYDFIRKTPGLISATTQFVRLFVCDQSVPGSTSNVFVDYGLYTQVEQYNTRFLKNHNLDSNGYFYKAEMFEFYRYEDALKLVTDPTFDQGLFDDVMECKGNNDHTKLIEMLTAVNDYGIPITKTFEKYFNADNYFSWLCINILTGNIDTTTRNFFLYNPQNSNTWYFIHWDNDYGFFRTEYAITGKDYEIGYEYGVANYWGVVLFNRLMRVPEYREQLDDKMNEVLKIFSPENIAAAAKEYSAVIKPIIYRMPDAAHAWVVEALYDDIIDQMDDEILINYQLYLDSLDDPMPFYNSTPIYNADKTKLVLSWDAAYDFDAELITYTVEVADNYLFENPIATFTDVRMQTIEIDALPQGQYFFRVKATNESGHEQYAFDYYTDSNHLNHYGTICFYILADGSIV